MLLVHQLNSAGTRVLGGADRLGGILAQGGGGAGKQLLGRIQASIPRLHGPDSDLPVSLAVRLLNAGASPI